MTPDFIIWVRFGSNLETFVAQPASVNCDKGFWWGHRILILVIFVKESHPARYDFWKSHSFLLSQYWHIGTISPSTYARYTVLSFLIIGVICVSPYILFLGIYKNRVYKNNSHNKQSLCCQKIDLKHNASAIHFHIHIALFV